MTDMEPAPADNLVRAAGAVLVDGDRVALVHRPRYDDWTLPKGKHEPGEDDVAAALREVREETGFHGRIERDLGVVRYTVEKHGVVRPKVVRYYVMRAAAAGAFVPNAVMRIPARLVFCTSFGSPEINSSFVPKKRRLNEDRRASLNSPPIQPRSCSFSAFASDFVLEQPPDTNAAIRQTSNVPCADFAV